MLDGGVFRFPRLRTHLSYCISTPEMTITVAIWGSAREKYVVIVAWVTISSKQANKGVLSPHNVSVAALMCSTCLVLGSGLAEGGIVTSEKSPQSYC